MEKAPVGHGTAGDGDATSVGTRTGSPSAVRSGRACRGHFSTSHLSIRPPNLRRKAGQHCADPWARSLLRRNWVLRAVRWRNPSDRADTRRATRVAAPPAGPEARGVVDGVVLPEQGAAPHGRRPALNPLPRSGPGKTKSCLECAPGGRASPAFPRNLLETRAGRLTERTLAGNHGWAETRLPDSAVRTATGRR